MHKLLRASLALALAAPFGALADTPSEIESLRREIETMRADYEARLQALERRLRAAEARRVSAALVRVDGCPETCASPPSMSTASVPPPGRACSRGSRRPTSTC